MLTWNICIFHLTNNVYQENLISIKLPFIMFKLSTDINTSLQRPADCHMNADKLEVSILML